MKFSIALITYLHYMSSKIDWHFIMYLCIVCAQESIADLDKWLVDPSIIDITKSADCDDAWCDNCDILILTGEELASVVIEGLS